MLKIAGITNSQLLQKIGGALSLKSNDRGRFLSGVESIVLVSQSPVSLEPQATLSPHLLEDRYH